MLSSSLDENYIVCTVIIGAYTNPPASIYKTLNVPNSQGPVVQN